MELTGWQLIRLKRSWLWNFSRLIMKCIFNMNIEYKNFYINSWKEKDLLNIHITGRGKCIVLDRLLYKIVRNILDNVDFHEDIQKFYSYFFPVIFSNLHSTVDENNIVISKKRIFWFSIITIVILGFSPFNLVKLSLFIFFASFLDCYDSWL